MPIFKKPDWSLPDKDATDEDVYLSRRRILTAMGVGGVIDFGSTGRASCLAQHASDDAESRPYRTARA